MDRQIASIAEDNSVAVLAFSIVTHRTSGVLSRKVHVGFRHALHLHIVLLVGWVIRKRGVTHQKEPFLLQLVKDDLKYLWRYLIGLLFPAVNIELGQPVKVLKT